MIWLSIDPAKGASGVAVWDGVELKHTCTVKPRGAKGIFYGRGGIYACRYNAWRDVVGLADGPIIIEKGAGGMLNAVDAQGWIRGYIACECERTGRVCTVVNVSEWRRVIKEQCGISWPASRDRKKALSVQLVERLYGRRVNDDEADAVLLGRAAMALGYVRAEGQA